VLLIFTGLGQKTALPLELIHPLLTPCGVSLVYLRDRQRLLYLNGIASLGDSYGETLAALGRLLPDTTRRLLCFGNSAGGYGALRYGLDLGAERVLGMGAPTDLRPDTLAADARGRAVCLRLEKRVPEMAVDLRPLFESAPRRPRVDLWYGDDMPQDTLHAENLRGVDGVGLHDIAGCAQHDILWHLVGEGRAQAVFREFLAADRDSDPVNRSFESGAARRRLEAFRPDH
jgi:hypothetical protein